MNLNIRVKKESNYLIIGVIIVSVIIFGSYIIELHTLVNTINYNGNYNNMFISFFNFVLSVLAVLSCYLSYSSNKNDELFLIALMYSTFCIDMLISTIIIFNAGQGDWSYIAIGTSTVRLIIASIAVINKNKFKKIIIDNKIKSSILILVTTIILISIEYRIKWSVEFIRNRAYIDYNVLLCIVYGVISIIFFIRSIKEKEYIYSVIGSSIFMFTTKSIYSIVGVTFNSPEIRIVSVAITYTGFIIFILGLFVEIIYSIKRNKILEEKVDLFYNIVEKNEYSNTVICDENYNIVYSNKKYRDNYGINDEYNHKLDIVNFGLNNEQILDIEKSLSKYGYWSENIENDDFVIEFSIQTLKKEGNIYKVIIFKDISEKHAMEKAILKYESMKQHENMKNEFFANVSHELKTPLNIIYSTTQLLNLYKNKPNFNELYIKHQNTITVNCQRMLRLIDNIVDMTKLDIGFKTPNFANYDIVRLIEGLTMSVVNYAKQKDIQVIFDTDIEELEIKCDPDMIERVILNLLSNAIKFTNENSFIYVDIFHDDNNVTICVKDEGIGIPEELQPIIFNRFVQGDKSLRRRNEGSGIGLSIVKSIVEVSGGEIFLYSDGKNGSEFRVVLPNKKLDCIEMSYKNNDYNLDTQKIELEFSDIYDLYEI